ncbi:VOC family protein [Mycolicibacterium sp. 018/SC-01/001]|uniref:VOC family protein n=1 Tax=Mycolicibacterium sp. 018/SC-01/001 TaxID=2592069 RepID=UPI0011804D08|nr:VOC family protein [Mycolicibacterium sp. 018/SC-01/001]TRW80279.1 VOC family protein [Mycolicibacterium sp. 018/SC-01/001]
MPLPGMVGTDHIGFTVPDLEQAHDFFVRVLGCAHVYTLGPFAHDDNWMKEHLNVHPRTVMKELRFYRCGSGANFEVFFYDPADGQTGQPRNSDIGGHHLAFYVQDMDEAVGYLRAEGIEVLGEPTASRGASEGQRWVYFLSPWGMQFELVSFPDGKAYEADAEVLLWNPNDPAK